MKFLHNYNSILESVTYAKAVLRKKDLDVNNPEYLKICDITNKDGFTDILTKLHFMSNVDLNEISELYNALKSKKVDASKLLKMKYEDILTLVYEDELDTDSDIILAFKYSDYNVYRVKTYEAGLKINSPAWCLKTKSYYDNYTSVRGGTNFVAIKERFSKKGTVLLPTPSDHNGNYENLHYPMSRIGLTLFRNKDFEYFDDNNTTNVYTKYRDPVKSIVEECFKWLRKNEPSSLELNKTKSYEEFEDILLDIIGDYKKGSFDFVTYTIDQSQVNEALNVKIGGQTIKELFNVYKDEIMKNLCNYSGLMDILIYECFGKEANPLSGMYLKERENVDKFIRYTYGIHKYVWGRKYILQSYKSVRDYLKFIVDNLHYFFIEDDNGLDSSRVLIDEGLSQYFDNIDGFILNDFDAMYTIHENPKGFQVVFNLVKDNVDITKFSNKIVSYFEELLGKNNVDLNGTKLSLFFDEHNGE